MVSDANFLHLSIKLHVVFIHDLDKTVKLWKFGPRRKYVPRAVQQVRSTGQIALPQEDTSRSSEVIVPSCKRSYSNAHAYHINSLALNSDHETFVSADDLRVNLWRLDNKDTTFSELFFFYLSFHIYVIYCYCWLWLDLIDIKPECMEELTEVITSVQCHPQHCNTLTFSSSRGTIKVCDTRVAAYCRSFAKIYYERPANANRSFITDMLHSISDIKWVIEYYDSLIFIMLFVYIYVVIRRMVATSWAEITWPCDCGTWTWRTDLWSLCIYTTICGLCYMICIPLMWSSTSSRSAVHPMDAALPLEAMG